MNNSILCNEYFSIKIISKYSLFIKSLPPDTPVPSIEQLKEEISRTTIKGIILNEVIQNTPGLSEKDIKEINLTYSCLLKSKNMDEFKNCSPN